MFSVASLLNPAAPGSASVSHFHTPPRSSSPSLSFADRSSFLPDRCPHTQIEKQKMGRDHSGYAKSKAKGIVNFPPFEDLDDGSLREVRKYNASPLGAIQNKCRHIPYNSGKKDFFEKTGRESFEVFQYTFQVPNDDTEYTVMWDYNVGLVRMTPFFKCCNYPKTTPAKMLNMNPGLRDITHSITGGSIMAQGYWMPFACARAVCATFCHHISGALIPIFGPRFPSMCIPPDAPDYGRMCIDAAIVAESTQEADRFRRLCADQSSLALPASPRQLQLRRSNNNTFYTRGPLVYDHNSSPYSHRQPLRHGRVLDSPYGTDTDDNDGFSGPETGAGDFDLRGFPRPRYPYTPVPSLRSVHTAAVATSSGWTPHNMYQLQAHQHQAPAAIQPARYVFTNGRDQQHHDANPWLSSVPRLEGYAAQALQPSPSHPPPIPLPPRHQHALPHAPTLVCTTTVPTLVSSKRPRIAAEYLETDHEYDGGESQGSSPTNPHPKPAPRGDSNSNINNNHHHHGHSVPLPSLSNTTAERNAAMLLMNLSMTETDGADSRKQDKAGVYTNCLASKESNRFRLTPEIGSMRQGKGCWDDERRSKRKRATSV